mmetsp:Transcript_20709/g.45467  ORF Transcript_20709/g.45467 Transcript_20709/m.45467 type:complete len:445 (+) Transcript_20709:138-1472(+)
MRFLEYAVRSTTQRSILSLAPATQCRFIARRTGTLSALSPPSARSSTRLPSIGQRWASPLAAAGAMTTDSTFRYKSFDWEVSNGQVQSIDYILAQQPAGGETAQRDALSALEEKLPRPTSGCSVLLIPSVSVACGGKEEMRPLASGLAQRGHRCYILEWPGWSVDTHANFALVQCKPEELSAEYEDFWCQMVEHIAKEESSEEACKEGDAKPQLCVVAAGHGATYALRAVRRLLAYANEGAGSADTAHLRTLTGLALLAPSWRTQRGQLWSYLTPAQASRRLGSWLHADTRLSKYALALHLSERSLRRKLLAARGGVPPSEILKATASWLFRRDRPYVQTDGATLFGLLDPPNSSAETLAAELLEVAPQLSSGAMLLRPETPGGSSGGPSGTPEQLAELLAANPLAKTPALNLGVLPSKSKLPHEDAPSATLAALDAWLAKSPS